MERYRNIIDRLPGFAEEQRDIDAVVVIGSQSRRERPADEYSDLDLVIFCRAPRIYLDDAAWLARFGEVVCTFTEPTIGGYMERRVLYRDNRDIDITVLPPFDICSGDLLGNPSTVGTLRTGYRVVYDRTGTVEGAFERAVAGDEGPTRDLSPVALDNLVGDFNYHIVWAAKKLRRGELWTAVSCINCYLAPRLLTMLSHYHTARNEVDNRRYGRFIDTDIPQELREELTRCISRYDRMEARRALDAQFDLFNHLASSVYGAAGYPVPDAQRAEIARLLTVLDTGRQTDDHR